MWFAKPLLAAFALGSMVALPAHAELDVASLKPSIEISFESEYPKLDALYKDIHAHPEIAFQEEKTAAKLAAEMRAIGFEVTEKVGKTGLVALYKMATVRPSWCAPSLTRCRWRRRPACPTQAATRPSGRGAKPLSPIAAATTSTWRAGSERRRRWSG